MLKHWLRKAVTAGAVMPLSLQAWGVSTTATSAKSSELFGQLRFESMQYGTTVDEATELNASQFLSARLSTLGNFDRAPRFTYGADASTGTFFRRSQTQFVVHEANLGVQLAPGSSLTVGRKKAWWSGLDENWQLGLWQPKFAIDALRPEDQGLTGMFLDWKEETFELRGFVTAVYIPAMGPEIREEGGGLVSDSRWYRQPSRTQTVNGRINSVAYNLDVPEVSKLVANPGTAMMGRWGSREQGPWMAGSVGYKPVNELILKREIRGNTNSDVFDITVAPEVEYHDIASADLGYAFENVQVSVSYLEDRPRGKGVERDHAIQRLQPIKAYSGQFDWMLKNIFSRSVQLRLGYLKVNGGGITDVNSNGEADDFTLFDSRLKFTDAVSVGMEGQLTRIYRKPLVTKFRYLYDWDQRGSLVNTEFLFYPDQQWAVLMGADVMGVEDETHKPSGFLNQFRANDRVYGGMSYVF